MTHTLSDDDWETLLLSIRDKMCTPFIGAGACYGALPLGGEIARSLAARHDYPLSDTSDLPRVTQYIAVKYGSGVRAKQEVLEGWFKAVNAPDFTVTDEPHGVLADLPLPIYITTNYDDFMIQALKSRQREPRQELCKWNKFIKDKQRNIPSLLDGNIEPTSANPVVFYLHGSMEEARSLVLIEDDYVDFLVNITKDFALVPSKIQEVLAYNALLFIGYSLQDWNFRVLFRALVSSKEVGLRQRSFAVQLPESDKPEYQAHMDEYFGNMDIRFYWGTARDFAAELGKRWKVFTNGNKP